MRTYFKSPQFLLPVACLLVVAVCLFLRIPMGVQGQWTWFYRPEPFKTFNWTGTAVFLSLVGIVLVMGLYKKLNHLKIQLPIAVLIGMVLTHVQFWASDPTQLLLSDFFNVYGETNPFFKRSLQIDDGTDYLRNHHKEVAAGYWQRPREERRLSTYPPGLPLFYFGMRRLVEAVPGLGESLGSAALELHPENSDLRNILVAETSRQPAGLAAAKLSTWMGYLLSALAAVPIWLLAREFTREHAIYPALAWLLVPAPHLFVPEPSTFFPCISATLGWLAVRASRTEQTWLFLPAGILASLALLLSASFIPIVLFCILFLVGFKPFAQRLKLHGVLLLIAGGTGMALILSWIGYNQIAGILTALENNKQFYDEMGRTYWAWLPGNAWDFALFIGLPYFALLLWETARQIRNRLFLKETFTAERHFMLLFVVLFFSLVLAGTVRGEVGRNWQMLMPFALVALFINQKEPHHTFVTTVSTTSLCMLLLGIFLDVRLGWLTELGSRV